MEPATANHVGIGSYFGASIEFHLSRHLEDRVPSHNWKEGD